MIIIFNFNFEISEVKNTLKKERIELEGVLEYVLFKHIHDRKTVKKINEILDDPKIVDAFDQLFAGKRTLSSLSIPMLCVITCAVYEATEAADIKPTDFFMKSEIDQYKSMDFANAKESTNDVKLPIIFDEVIMLDPENYVTVVDTNFLVKMLHNNLIHYDYKSQRSAIYIKGKDGDAIPVQELNMQSVTDISDHMLNGTYLPDTLSLNVYSDEIEPIIYNSKKKQLEISEGAYITILDGFHRLRGGERAVYLNPDLPQKLFLTIRSYDEETSKRYFGQINTVNVVAPERLRELKSERTSDLVVRDLQRNSELKEKIASAPSIYEVAGQLTTFDVLSYAIDKVYSPKTRIEAKETSSYLTDFFDYLIGSYYKEFVSNVNDFRKNYSHPLMFVGYIEISKQMLNKNIKPNKIQDIIKKIDFEDGELKLILNNPRGINNNRNRNKMIEYFKVWGENFV